MSNWLTMSHVILHLGIAVVSQQTSTHHIKFGDDLDWFVETLDHTPLATALALGCLTWHLAAKFGFFSAPWLQQHSDKTSEGGASQSKQQCGNHKFNRFCAVPSVAHSMNKMYQT